MRKSQQLQLVNYLIKILDLISYNPSPYSIFVFHSMVEFHFENQLLDDILYQYQLILFLDLNLFYTH